jgi:hypothetical protein
MAERVFSYRKGRKRWRLLHQNSAFVHKKELLSELFGIIKACNA